MASNSSTLTGSKMPKRFWRTLPKEEGRAPSTDKLALSPVTKLGLLYFYPDKISTKIASAGLIMELESSG
jgi:hypothetical protein